MVTSEVFFAISAIIIAILLGLLVPVLVELTKLRGDIKPICSLVNDVDSFFRQRGLNGISEQLGRKARPQHHSLSPEKAAERDALTQIGRIRGLTDIEATRLRQLLEEDARDDLSKGVVSVIAFAIIVIAIGALIESLSKK